jgi:parvulin-like peptidyl-prolyl isomerase
MRRSPIVSILAHALALAALACGSGSPDGPTTSGKIAQEEPAGPDAASTEIMARDADTNHAVVKHIVIPADQKALALDLLRRVRAGEAIEPLMKQHSKDPGSADSGESYQVRPDSELVFEFKRMALRLRVGEAGVVQSHFGWHVMKRIE